MIHSCRSVHNLCRSQALLQTRITNRRKVVLLSTAPYSKGHFVKVSLVGILISSPLSHHQQPISSNNALAFSTVPTMPQPPFLYCSDTAPTLDFSELGSQISQADKNRRDAYDVSREIQVKLLQAKTELEGNTATPETMEITMNALREMLVRGNFDDTGTTVVPPRTPRIANLSNRYEDYCRFLAFQQFLTTGGWLSPETCHAFGATDEEYLGGACMGVCRDLERYALGRATARDVSSVQAARNLVNEMLDYLMQFDFRNGPLRRKYDGTKYALKTLETLLYELSVTGATLNDNEEIADETTGEPQAKKPKIDTEKPQELLDALRSRMEHRDELREKLIKKCRDSQKAAKQAIYALHREDFEKAAKLIQQCEDSIEKELFPIVDEEPPLRSGSFANVLEEYAEAKLFQVWLLGDSEKNSPKGSLMLQSDFSIPLEAEEYLGGLCDLTGEIGRYAVQRGTARDYDGVRLCLEANSAVSLAISTLERAPGGINKKMDQLRRSVEKIERMTYEMSLSKAAGININTEVTESSEKDNDGE